MPKALEKELAARARKLGLKGARKNAYIFSVLDRIKKAKKKGRK